MRGRAVAGAFAEADRQRCQLVGGSYRRYPGHDELPRRKFALTSLEGLFRTTLELPLPIDPTPHRVELCARPGSDFGVG